MVAALADTTDPARARAQQTRKWFETVFSVLRDDQELEYSTPVELGESVRRTRGLTDLGPGRVQSNGRSPAATGGGSRPPVPDKLPRLFVAPGTKIATQRFEARRG
jgi:hypothetical protein